MTVPLDVRPVLKCPPKAKFEHDQSEHRDRAVNTVRALLTQNGDPCLEKGDRDPHFQSRNRKQTP